MAIWIFISIFGDIFRRNDLTGLAKAGWIFLIFILPFLGALIYIIARPKVTAQDVQLMAQAEAASKAAAGRVDRPTRSPSCSSVRDAGTITARGVRGAQEKALASKRTRAAGDVRWAAPHGGLVRWRIPAGRDHAVAAWIDGASASVRRKWTAGDRVA